MVRVLVVVEGQTERAVLQVLLAPYLGTRGISLNPRILGKPGHKGGARHFDAPSREITALVKQERESFVTTFFDYYAMPLSWPGVKESKGSPRRNIPQIVEHALHEAIKSKLGDSFNPARFIPYVQMYELEALLFSNPRTMAEVFEESKLEEVFREIVSECGGCEQIDDSPATAPSKRIEKHFASYHKGSGINAHAPIIVRRIGIASIRKSCPHFDAWVARLECLAS